VTETPPGTGDLATLRHEYDTHGVDVVALEADPIAQFAVWFEEAAAEGIYEPHAMALSTVDADGRPSCRYVLLRGVDERGFRFFTSYRSAKARDLDAGG
jgi:pyridoxamine 5'-phosphate oxidase